MREGFFSQKASRVVCLLALFGGIGVYLAAALLAGGSLFEMVRYFLAMLMLILPGVRLAELWLPQLKGAQKMAVSLPLAMGLALVSYWTLGRITPPLMAAPLLALAIWQLIVWGKKLRAGNRLVLPGPNPADLIGLLLGAGLVLNAFVGVLNFAHSQAAGNMIYHQDMLFSVGNAAAVQLGSPLPDIRVAGSHLQYHWLGDAFPGFGAMLSGIPVWDAVCYYQYPVWMLFALVGLFAAARSAGAGKWMSLLLPAGVFFFSGFESGLTINLYGNMNGVTTATALTAGLLVLLFEASKSEKMLPLPFFGAWALSMLALLMSKNLYGVLLSLAILAAVGFGLLIQRRFYKNGLVMGFTGLGLFGLCWVLVFSKAINNLVQEFWIGPMDLVKDIWRTSPIACLLWIVSIVVCLTRLRKMNMGQLTVQAAAIGGIMAYVLFHHYSASQVYFLLAAVLFFWFCLLEVEGLFTKSRLLRGGALAAAALCLGATVITLAPQGRKGVQVLLRCLDLRPQYTYQQNTITPGDEEAARWLHDHMKKDELFAVNRNAQDMTIGEGVWHYYTAASERQCLVESWRYSMDYGHDYHHLRYVLEQVSDVLFKAPDAETAFSMAREQGVRYLLVSKPLRSEPFAGADPVFENADTAIYDVQALTTGQQS